jgi:hypothetical protein
MDHLWSEGSLDIEPTEFYHSQTNLPNFSVAPHPTRRYSQLILADG